MRDFPPIRGELEAQLILVTKDLARLEQEIKDKILQQGVEKDKKVRELITMGLLEYKAQRAQYREEIKKLEEQISIS
jgi:galactokinase/mevalonate kinase-like predicted kinase